MNTIKVLKKLSLKQEDDTVFSLQLMQDCAPFIISENDNVSIVVADEKNIRLDKEMTIVDGKNGIVSFGIDTNIGTGSYDVEVVVLSEKGNFTFPTKGYEVLHIYKTLSDRPFEEIPLTQIEILSGKIDEIKVSKADKEYVDEQNLLINNNIKSLENNKSDKNHDHEISDINNLQSELDNKSDKNHIHNISDVENLQETINSKSDAEHEHILSDITDLDISLYSTTEEIEQALNRKANATHEHSQYIPFKDEYVDDANLWLTDGYIKTNNTTTNLPTTSINSYGILFYISEDKSSGTGTQMFFPIDNAYKGRVFVRSLTNMNNTPQVGEWSILATKSDVDSKSDANHTHDILDIDGLSDTIGNINSFDVVIVESLPSTDVALTHTIYMVQKTTSGTNNVYDEYMLLDGSFEKIGDTEIDLSQYATKTDLSNGLGDKAEKSHTHVLNEITDLDMTAYSKAVDVSNALNEKADKTALSNGLDGKADKSHTHTISEITNLQTELNNKSDSNHTHDEFNPMVLELENNNNNFSVGEDNTGTKYDVIESSESTIELNGRTLVNLWGNKPSDFITNPYVTFQNDYLVVTSNSNNYVNAFSFRNEMFKTSTKYTIISEVLENTLDGKFYINQQNRLDGTFNNEIKYNANETGIKINVCETQSSFSNLVCSLRSFVNNDCSTGNIKFRCTIVEGDFSNVPIEYFEGLQSVGEKVDIDGESKHKIDISSVGKNLFDYELYPRGAGAIVEYLPNGVRLTAKRGNYSAQYFTFQAKPNTTYTFSMDEPIVTSGMWQVVIRDVHNGELEGKHYGTFNKITNKTFTTSENVGSNGYKIGIALYCNASDIYLDNLDVTYTNIQIEEGSVVTPYEPYKSNKTEILLNEPLRSLPNGVKDEIFIHDDKLVVTRNVGQVVLDGSENWILNPNSTETYNIFWINGITLDNCEESYNSAYGSYIIPKLLSNNFKIGSTDVIGNLCMHYLETVKWLTITVDSTKDEFSTLEKLKTWLLSNNTNLVYKLATPTYEWFELPSPRLYKDGHVFIESGTVPLSTTRHEVNTSIRSAIDTNTNELWDVKNNIIDTNERIDEIVDDMYNESELMVTNDCNTFTMSDIAKDTSDTEIKLNGRTLVNLWGNKISDFSYTANDGLVTFNNNNGLLTSITINAKESYISCCSNRTELFKPSTLYTIIVNILSNTLNGVFAVNLEYNNESVFSNNMIIDAGMNGTHVFTQTSKPDISNSKRGLRTQVTNASTSGSITFQCIILEGDYTNVPISYFEGLQSAKPTQLLSCGKNLLDLSNLKSQDNLGIPSDRYNITSNDNTTIVSVIGSCGFYVPIYLKKGKTYLFNGNISNIANMRIFKQGDWITATDYLVVSKSETTVNKSITWIHDDGFYNFRIWIDANDTATLTDFQIEEGISRTQYEPYKGDSVTLPTIQPLRSLPNGVCDTAELKDDKLVITRNCGEVVLDGSADEEWSLSDNSNYSSTVLRFNSLILNDSIVKNDVNKIINDKFVVKNMDVDITSTRNSNCLCPHTNGYLTIFIEKSKLSTEDLSGFKTWLQSNNITIVYQLSTPTTEVYDLRTLHIYKHFFANTGAIPLTSNEHNEHYNTRDIIIANTEELLNAKRYIYKLENTIESLVNRIETLEAKNSIN